MSSNIPLTSAVNSGDEIAVSALLDNGADVNERTSGGQTAVILAVIRGHTNIVRLLVDAGANPYERDNLGLNAIDWAQRRGLTEAIDILTKARPSTPPKRILINLEEPAPEETPPTPEPEIRELVSEAEKSRRWVTGLKQRLDEQAQRRLNRNEPPPQPQAVSPEPEPVKPEPPPPVQPPSEPIRTHSSRILTPPPVVETGKRKRCPKCNAVYKSDLLSYCAYDTVPLVDIDQPPPSEQLPPVKSNLPLFWIMIVLTLMGSIIIGSLITAYLYRSNQAAARTAGEKTVQKGLPELGGDLVGKAVSLPEAECPVRGREPASGTVTVYIIVAKNGQVYKARGLGGDWLMRGCATEAAMKSTFTAEKLTANETQGTITYTFKP